jgi:ABC-type transporter Mla subunit MlaD
MVDVHPVVTASVRKKFGAVYKDAKAVLRPNTPLEDMYLDVVAPGTKAAGLADAATPIPSSQTATVVHVDDVLNVFQADVRARLRVMLDQLGNGLQDRGAALRQAFVKVAPFVDAARRLTQQVADRAHITGRLVHNAALLTSEVGRRDAELRQLVRDGSGNVKTLQAGAGDLDATLRELPPTIAGLTSSFRAVDGVLGDADGAVRSLRPVADRLSGALEQLKAIGVSGGPAVRALHPPVRRLVGLARALTPLSRDLDTSVRTLRPQVPVLDRTTLDLVKCRTGVEGFFLLDPSLSKYGDARGLHLRGNLAAGSQSSGEITNPFEFSPKSCAPGAAIGGRLPVASDKH